MIDTLATAQWSPCDEKQFEITGTACVYWGRKALGNNA